MRITDDRITSERNSYVREKNRSCNRRCTWDGKAIALELAKAGNLVVINYNGSEEKARETKAEIEAAGGQADILQCNVADFDACEAFFKAVAEKYGRVDILVNNAGVTKDGLLMKMSEEDFPELLTSI